MKVKLFNISVLLFLFVFTASLRCDDKKFCDQCGNAIKPGSSYILSNGKIYCDQECYEKSLPACSVCGKPVKTGYVQNGKNYCSDKCLQASWEACVLCGKKVRNGVHYGSRTGDFYCVECSKKPLCFACNLPNDCITLKDGRKICPKCRASSIVSYKKAMDIIRDVRRKMKEDLGIFTDNEIKFELVDDKYLRSRSQNKNPELELGLFFHEQRIKTETSSKKIYGFEFGKKVTTTQTDSFYIYLLTDLPEDKFIEVTAHELAHDWMEEKYPNIKEMKISEGWAEYTASRINSLYGNEQLNERMKTNTNPVYGDGYRFIADYAAKHKVAGLYKLFAELNQKK